MLKKKKSQGLSITTIILAVIGLIILVVLIMMITGRLGGFSKGVASSALCENVCKSLNKDKTDSQECTNGQKIPGDYEDTPAGCCCT